MCSVKHYLYIQYTYYLFPPHLPMYTSKLSSVTETMQCYIESDCSQDQPNAPAMYVQRSWVEKIEIGDSRGPVQ